MVFCFKYFLFFAYNQIDFVAFGFLPKAASGKNRDDYSPHSSTLFNFDRNIN